MPSPSYVPVIPAGRSVTLADVTVTGDLTVQGVGAVAVAIKGSSTGRASTTTPAPDPDLSLPVAAHAVYLVEMVGAWTSGGGGIRLTWDVPAGAQMVWTDNDGVGASSAAVAVTFATATGTSFLGSLVTGPTAGDLTLMWSQSTSNAAPTTMVAGCTLALRRVA